MAERNKHRTEYIAFFLIFVFFFALAITATFFIVLLLKKWCSLHRTVNTSVDTKCTAAKSSPNPEEKILISYQIQCNQPDILNKVTEGSKLNLHQREDTQTFSLESPFNFTMKNKIPGENVSLHQSGPESPTIDDKTSIYVTTKFGPKNENKVTCKKVENISNTDLTDAIFGPESAV